jgi:hypothetical protein
LAIRTDSLLAANVVRVALGSVCVRSGSDRADAASYEERALWLAGVHTLPCFEAKSDAKLDWK